MESHLFFSQLVLFALIWLFILLHLSWPQHAVTVPVTAAQPAPLKRKRSNEPKAFEGLTQKPHCALCEQETTDIPPLSPVRPDPMPPTNRRPRTVDTSMHFCPHLGCDYRGWLERNNLRANGHPNGGPWRQFHCRSCNGYFPEHHGTIFHGKEAAVELIVRVLACLAEGLGIRATARVFEVDPNTVLHWLVEAAEQLKAFSSYFLCEVHVQQVQLDALYTVLSAVKDGQMREEEAIRRLSRSPQWVWTAIDPQSKLLLAILVGPRTQAMAQRVVPQVREVLAPGCIPLLVTDGFKEYMSALLSHCGSWVQPARRQAQGPAPKPR
jgi:transposase-like protein